eukprot:370890-Ditylum_brightwellii.AAC.1
MPENSRVVDPIAQGVVKKIGGKGSIWDTNNVKLRTDQVLVEMKKVFDPKRIIHYPHSRQQ